MKALKNSLVILLILLSIFLIGCTKKTNDVTLGEINDNTYTNDFFNMKIDIPKDWYLATKEEMDQLTNMGNQAISGDDKKLEKQLDLAKLKTLNLLFIFKHPLNYNEGVNPNFMCIAENLGLAGASVKTGKNYLDSAKTLMQQAGLPYTFSEYGKESIGGKEFTTMDATINLGDLVITQRYHTAIIEGYALNFILSYTTEEEYSQLKNTLNTVKL